ncbi:MBOAT family O-acyltransferase [uncultured Mesonia sp.]|uniref:MBOAT family O-acyltransferase n=1 Tax=uncultured Mesonia sp. TaxID=399731 RepID=UPI00374FACA7
MLFNSIDFAVFLPIVFALYWLLRKHLRAQNVLIALASYVFYGWWDWRFLFLILFSTLVDFFVGLQLEKSEHPQRRKLFLYLSLGVNLGLLGFFKYYNFFIDNFNQAFSFFGSEVSFRGLEIILPVGISFYTFQTLSYTIDIYRRKLPATRNFIAFAAFVSFFPQLVAGPIERATQLLPQFFKPRKFDFDKAKDGVMLIIWGLFKKIVIADNAAQYVNDIFQNHETYSGTTLLLGGVYFAFQIYGDFSGYSDIAIGLSRLFGFDLMRNFAYPYFSRDIAEFWRRWHISLSTWFRDYLYIPLGGSRGSTGMQVRNTFIIFVVSGFWHGANWTFIVWGALNALYFLPLLLTKRNRKNMDIAGQHNKVVLLKELGQILLTFGLTVIAWVFFRADSVSQAVTFLNGMFTQGLGIDRLEIERFSFEILPLIALLLLIEWYNRHYEHPLKTGRFLYFKALFLIFMILVWGSFSDMQEFIYFQF